MFKVRHAVMGKIALKLARTELLQRVGREVYAKLEGGPPPVEPLILPPGGRVALPAACDGSNSWAVHGSRTTTGAPVLCNDSHRPLDVPNVYWQCAVSWPGIEAAGGAFAGFPAFPHFGFNGAVGWNITHAMADAQDLYAEIFDTGHPSRYLTEHGWREASIAGGSIEVRGSAAVEVQVVRTRHGVVIDGDPRDGRAVALRTTATDRPSRQWECLRPMLAAGSIAALFETQRGWEDPVNNLVAAAAAGSVDPATWRWESVHRCAPRHPLSAAFPEAAADLDPPAFGMGGDNDTIRVASLSLAAASGLGVRDVSIYRQVIDFAARRMLWSIPGGASGVAGSRHRADQLEAWRECRLVPAPLSVPEAMRAAESELTLEAP